jgi:hypothetical protein
MILNPEVLCICDLQATQSTLKSFGLQKLPGACGPLIGTAPSVLLPRVTCKPSEPSDPQTHSEMTVLASRGRCPHWVLHQLML